MHDLDLNLTAATRHRNAAKASRHQAMRTGYDRITNEIPDHILTAWTVRLFCLINLAWSYIETVLDIAAQMKIRELKTASRIIRNLKVEYDRFRWPYVLHDTQTGETERALAFEDYFANDFKILFHGIESEIRSLHLDPQYAPLIVAVQQALTLCDAVKVMARRIDLQLSDVYHVPAFDCSFVQNEFLKAAELLPIFAGDCFQPDLAIRHQTATILANRMESVEINTIAS